LRNSSLLYFTPPILLPPPDCRPGGPPPGYATAYTNLYSVQQYSVELTLQVQAVLLVTCQWTQSATESFTLYLGWHGGVQVTTVYLVVDRWLFSPTLDVRQTTDNWPTG